MPTRLGVLLQSRKSAAAGCGASTITLASAQPKRALERAPVGREHGTWCKLIVVRRSFIVLGGRISRRPSGAVNIINQDSAEIVHVGTGRTRFQKVIEAGEEFGRIVVTKIGGGIEAERTGTVECRVVHIGPGGIVGAAYTAV